MSSSTLSSKSFDSTKESKSAFVSWGLTLDVLKRCWPLWLFYLLFLVVEYALPLATQDGNTSVLASSNVTLIASLVISLLAALASFKHLYTTSGACFYGALPLKRGAVFRSMLLAGLLPFLAVDVLAGLLILVAGLHAAVPLIAVGTWLLYALMLDVVFYGLAVLCVLLAGNIGFAVLYYVAANFIVVAIELCLNEALTPFIFGWAYSTSFDWASPAYFIANSISLDVTYRPDMTPTLTLSGPLSGWGALAIYCLFGTLCMVLAGVLYRHRHLERAGMAVAFSRLSPVLEYVAAIAGAIVLGAGVFSLLFYGYVESSSLQNIRLLVLILCMIAGAFVGSFIAGMGLQRSVRIKARRFLPAVVLSILSICFAFACRFDLFNLENKVPDEDNILSVCVDSDVLAQDSNIQAARTLQQTTLAEFADGTLIVDNDSYLVDSSRAASSELDNTFWVSYTIDYKLTSGKHVVRSYSYALPNDLISDAAHSAQQYTDLLNSLEVREAYLQTHIDNVAQAQQGTITIWDEQEDTYLTKDIAVLDLQAFFKEAYAVDVRENMGECRSFWQRSDETWDESDAGRMVTVSFNYMPTTSSDVGANGDEAEDYYCWDSVSLTQATTPASLAWLAARGYLQ